MSSALLRDFLPKSFQYLKDYSWALFRKDLASGVTVGIIALPLAMAFAIASGVTPERGLFTAIVAGFLISLLGGSRVQIGGPTGAFVVIVYDIIQRTGYSGLCASTLIASALLILLGLSRLGSWIKYVPHPLVTGFTTGIAVIIFSSQIKDFLGLKMGTPPADFIEKWRAYVAAFPTIDWSSAALGLGSLGFILFLRRYVPKVPWGIASVAIATAAAYFLHLPVATVFSRFGEIPHMLPAPSLSCFSIPEGKVPEICFDAITIAFLGGIESLLSAVIADGMIGGRHRSNCELVAQGVANFGSVLFGGIPATGAIARTAANVKTGAQTPLSGMIHAATLFFILLFLSPVVSLIPLPALAAVLFIVAWNMSEAGHFFRLLKSPWADRAILLIAFFLTVFVDITVAITFGMVLACFLFMKRMSDLSKTVPLTKLFREAGADFPEKSDPDAIQKKNVPPEVEVYEIQGPFFFGAADMLKDLLAPAARQPKVFILRMRHVPMIDASGFQALKEFCDKCKKNGTVLLLSGIRGQTERDLQNFGVADSLGSENILPHIDAALERARAVLSTPREADS